MIVRLLPETEEPSALTEIRICQFEDLPIGLGRAFEVQGRTIALFRTRAGKVFAFDNQCPHKKGPLAEGMLAGESVVCPLHAFRFDMNTGDCEQPNTCGLRTYQVQLRDHDVFIRIS